VYIFYIQNTPGIQSGILFTVVPILEHKERQSDSRAIVLVGERFSLLRLMKVCQLGNWYLTNGGKKD
jgi:hypothetical protein